MNIQDLKKTHPRIAALAESLRCYEETTDEIDDMFHWKDTPQGYDFWKDVEMGIDLDQKETALTPTAIKHPSNLKFRVNSPEHSEAIQRRLFELGYKWYNGVEPKHKQKAYLFCDVDKEILCSNLQDTFTEHQNTEATLNDLYPADIRETLTVKEVEERFNIKVKL